MNKKEAVLLLQKEDIDPKAVCVGCDEKFLDMAMGEENDRIVDRVASEKGLVCGHCFESDESNSSSVVFYNYDSSVGGIPIDDDEGRSAMLCRIGDYFDETGGQFGRKYIETDGWRGYYETVVKGCWTLLHEDQLLAYSEDGAELREMIDKIKNTAIESGIPIAVMVNPTSNVFSSNVDVYVHDDHAGELDALMKKLVKEHRSAYRHAFTAMTGKDLKNAEPGDHEFALIGSAIMASKATKKEK